MRAATRILAATGAALALAACSVPNLPPPQQPTGAVTVTTVTTTPASTSASATAAQTSTAAPTPPTPTTSRSTPASQQPDPLAPVDAPVVSVYDGDTFTVTIDGERESVRPLGIDAPELENKSLGIAGECYGPQSKDALVGLVRNVTVRLTVDPQQGNAKDGYRDQYHRLLRYVEVPVDTGDIATATQTVDLGDWQLRNGNAWVFEQYPVARTPQYEQEMHVAQADHTGLWGACE